jgi:hypothetical protein
MPNVALSLPRSAKSLVGLALALGTAFAVDGAKADPNTPYGVPAHETVSTTLANDTGFTRDEQSWKAGEFLCRDEF